MLPSILIVDDEVEVLKALKRLLCHEYQVNVFTDTDAALSFFTESPTHVVISDLMMPGMDGAEFLNKISTINAKCKRIALTGFASAELAKKAINDGHISSYLTKPWDNNELKRVLSALVNELRQENRKQTFLKKLSLDNKQLHTEQQINEMAQEQQQDNDKQLAQLKNTSNELLMLNANLIAMYSKEISGHSLRVAQQSKALAIRMKLDPQFCQTIYFAALFHRIGIASLPENVISQPWRELTAQEHVEYFSYVQASADILTSITLLKSAANIVRHIYEQVNGNGLPDKLTNEHIPIGAKILRIVIDFDLIVNGVISDDKQAPNQALTTQESQVNRVYDSAIFKNFVAMLSAPKPEEKIQLVKLVSALTVDMEVAQDIYDAQQHKLLAEGTKLTASHIEHLQNIEHQQTCMLLAYVYS